MKRRILYVLLLTLVVAVACSGGDQGTVTAVSPAGQAAVSEVEESTAVPPTEEPTVEPTLGAVEIEAEAEMLDLGALVEHPWQWVSFTNPVEQFDVEMPQNYLLTFNNDGSLVIVADCNNVLGSYTADAGSLTIQLGPATLALCPGESRGEQFVALLGGAARYFFEEGQLFIDLMADGGTLVFTPAAAEAAEGADAAEAAPDDSTGEEITGGVDLAFLQNLDGWMWMSYSGPDGDFDIENPTIYTIFFEDDLSATLVGECNFILGSYTLDGEQFSMDVPMNDLLECSEGSHSKQFLEYLSQAESLVADQDSLLLTLKDGAGALRFVVNDYNYLYRVDSWEEATNSFLNSCDAPGAVLLIDNPQGRFLRAYGLANPEDGTAMETNDRFEIGSNTKSFTVVLALQLQEEGVWSLDDLLSQWLPEEAALLPYGDQMTLRQMASNSSGVWDYANPLIAALIESGGDLEQAYTPAELIDYVVENGEPSFAPGESNEYSSTNFILLGQAIEAATGEAIADLYQERIFDPLGMESSSFLEGVPEEEAIVNGYYTLPTGEVLNTTNENGSQMWAAGGIISTAEDMARYAAALQNGTLFQDPDSLAQMTAFSDQPMLPFRAYGLGVGRFIDEPLAWGHGGQTAGFQTLFSIFPESDTRLVLLTNSATCRVQDLMYYIENSPNLLTGTE